MGRRVVNGNTHSEDGWPLVDQDGCNWVTIPGTNPPVSIQIQKGEPTAVLRAWEADWNAYIEPLRDADTACWTEGNSVLGQPGRNNGSNHLGGTATDSNWSSHRFQISYDGFNQAQIVTMREMLDFYEGNVFWAQDWDSPKDCMHSQMGYGTYDSANDRPSAKVQDFINRKIRPDGFSTFRRGNAPPQPVSKQDQYALAVLNEGRRRGISPRGIQIAFATVFVESNWKMYANSSVPESMALPHDAVGHDHDSIGLFQQRCPMWGPANVLMNPALSAGLFFDHLAALDYDSPAHSPGFYAQAVQRSAFPDRYDQRFGDAAGLYNRLAGAPIPQPPPIPTGGFLMALTDAQQQELYDAVCGRRPSLSPLRPPGDTSTYTMRDMVDFADGSVHVLVAALAAKLGHPATLALLEQDASTTLMDRPDDKDLATAILASLNVSAPAPPVYIPPPAPLPVPVETNGNGHKSLGDIAKTVVDAIEQLKLSDALSAADYATLEASIKILQMKNGTQ